MSSSSSPIKCLMIGQAGVGKSAFLKRFPNAKKLASPTASDRCDLTPSGKSKSEWKETYSIEYMNSQFETVRIDLDNCDISLDTCLHGPSASFSSSVGLAHSATVDERIMAAASTTTTTTANNITENTEKIKRDETSSSLANRISSLIPIIPTHSCKFIDIAPYNVIVLCFSLDDAHSLELIKSKWEIDLKKNRAQQHSFLLVGFKSDLVFQDSKTDKENTTLNGNPNALENKTSKATKKKSAKNRSSSVNSTSSTSRLKRRERVISCEQDAALHKLILNSSKKFAKQIGAGRVLMPMARHTSNQIDGAIPETNSNTNQSSVVITRADDDLSVFDKFLKSVTKKSELVERQKRREQEKQEKMLTKKKPLTVVAVSTAKTTNAKENRQISAFTSKIPKSISTPISFLKAKALYTKNTKGRAKINEDNESLDEISLHDISENNQPTKTQQNTINKEYSNESFVDKQAAADETNDKSNETNNTNGQQKDNLTNNKTVCNKVAVTNNNINNSNNLTIRTKLSRFAIGLGTFLVTCGASTRTRKLADMKKLKNMATHDESSTTMKKNTTSSMLSAAAGGAGRKLPNIKRHKSWLLLASELSLNSTENDDVFS